MSHLITCFQASTRILFSEFTPQFVGLLQINLTIPGGIKLSKQVRVVIRVGMWLVLGMLLSRCSKLSGARASAPLIFHQET